MDEFIWSEEFCVDNEELNTQHRRIFDLGNRIIHAPLADAPEYTLALFSHIRTHFKTEEAHMASIGFPGLEAHKELHNQLISDFNRHIEFGISDPETFRKFKRFLYRWIHEHILERDLAYVAYARDQRPSA